MENELLAFNVCINRIRLEFKARGVDICSPLFLCINRIRLEFKVTGQQAKGFDYMVLIESDWNLKKSFGAYVETVLLY